MSFPQHFAVMTTRELKQAVFDHTVRAASLNRYGDQSLRSVRELVLELRLAQSAAVALEQRMEGVPAPKLGD